LRAEYEHFAEMDGIVRRLRELAARTVIFDIEPLVSYWDSGQESLDHGVTALVSRMKSIAGVQVVCLATNSRRRPSAVPSSAGVRVVYLASAGKPLRIAAYRGFPEPGVVVGDQIATDGVLARRLGYAFVQYCPGPGPVPVGPRWMDRLGRLVRPLLFTRSSG
jgi:predicted HAD superfamily phosphohydrolase YqeG